LSKRVLADVCEPRYDELFKLVRAEIRRSGFDDLLAAGVVLTGGASMITGALELGERIFQAPVRLGIPENVTGLVDVVKTPICATGIGLLIYGYQQEGEGRDKGFLDNGSLKGLWGKMKGWFTGNF